MIPSRVGEGDLGAERLERLGLLLRLWHYRFLCGSLFGYSDDSGLGRRFCFDFGLGVEAADLQLTLVLLQNAFIVVLPELLGGILAGDSLEDLLAT